MKKAVLMICITVSFVLVILSLFSNGPLQIFGFPVSGGVFRVAARAMLSELEKD